MDELKLLAGLPIVVEPNICMVKPLTLREIAAVGLELYYQRVNLATLSSFDVKELLQKSGVEREDCNPFDFLTEYCLANEMFSEEFRAAMRMLIGESVLVFNNSEGHLIYVGNPEEKRFFTKETFEEFQNIVRAQNIKEIEQPLTEKEREMRDKFLKKRKEVEEAKEREGKTKDVLSFDILVSALAANGNGLNIINVWDLSLYTFYDQFKRMQAIEEYQTGMELIFAGADPKKVQPKHYINKLEKNN